ncbi:MAG: carboxypeptidase M32 [Ignavibacteria bacterium]|nr:carboxypeptidase M32 [Ignavibacteria bacterium]
MKNLNWRDDMSKYEQNIKKAKEIINIQRYYESNAGLMQWDLWQGLSKDGMKYRQEVSGYFIKEQSKLIANYETKKLVEYFREIDENKYQNIYDKAIARILTRRYDDSVRTPIDLQMEMSSFISKAQMVWKEAMKNADFDLYKPYLKQMFELKTKIAQAIDNTKNPFDVLLNSVDEGLTVEKTDQLFSELKNGIISILPKIKDKYAAIDKSVLKVDCNKEIIRKISTQIVESTYFDKNKVTYWEVIHPVCVVVGPDDIRITSYFNDLFPSIFGMLHECGHGVYSYSSNPKAVEYGIWGGINGAMHESQGRFYENQIGRSKEFWEHFYPLLQSEIEEFKKMDLDTFYNALIKVEPSLNRITADEFTYSLHPIIRFEMEKLYFDGKLKTEDFYEAWNAKYKEYLGIEPKNAKEGVLQDVHWASGHVGYSQSYALGNLYCGQFRNAMLKDIPDVYQQIAKGDYSALNKWSYDNIYQYGNLYTPQELIIKATGEELKSKYFIEYLDEKFGH